ncbi:os-9 [Trichoderma arundinaceum]|uniref:Endoplasmic reticulum lectin n=1 Tax=Trichoderma arundinaceum TaxID=490622 RepID=A0A395NK13_TRIAR|nr:os-9 [Trichoderma arundinaceum]
MGKQFEVVFSDHFISANDAQSLLEYNIEHPTYSADFSQPTISDASDAAGDDHAGRYATPRGDSPLSYEVMNMPPHRYLCAIPVIEPPSPDNQTATELAKAEEARELGRAAVSGWNLLSELEDTCLYFMSGWWSYRFCNNREIVQFHALPSTPMGQPPQRDPHAAEYILGQAPTLPETSETPSTSSALEPKVPAELQVKGDQRYLVQKLGGGTICDLTGRPRTIEVQYHCVPGMQNDRIGWIKEVTICAYVMVVNTPRLCDDVAFLPPEESKANPITCQLIADDEKQAPPLLDQRASKYSIPDVSVEQLEEEEEERLQATGDSPLTVGGVLVGGRKSLSAGDQDGQPPVILSPPRNYVNSQQAAEQFIKVLVQAASKEDGGKVERLSKEELESLNIKPGLIEEMEEEMRQLAGDDGWLVEIVGDLDDEQRQLRGYLREELEDEKKAGKGGKGKKNDKAESKSNKKKQNGGANNGHGKGQEDGEGSEEQFFKEEL